MRNKIPVLISGLLLMHCSSPDKIRYEQYLVNGEQHYLRHCSNCHQADGSGLKDLYPPVAGSDFLADRDRVICLIRNGISGEITVNGKVYNQAMPASKHLYDPDIAELATYLYDRWGGSKTIIPPDTIKKILQNCEVRE